MEYGQIAGVNKPVSRLVLGTMIVSSDDPEKSFALLDEFVTAGGTTLDSAHVYGGGKSERGIGLWMERRGNREQVVVISKCSHPNADRKRVTPYDIASDLHDSLARLRTMYIDLYFLHRDDSELPVGPIVEALNEHHAAGKIRAFGGSNWTHQRLEEANAYAAKHGLVPFSISSPNLSLADQQQSPWGPDCITISGPKHADARCWYAEHKMPIFAWSSLARGFFSGRLNRENFKEAALDPSVVKAYCYEENFQRLERAAELAKEKGLSVPQVALAWVLEQPIDIYALIGAANREEIAANVGALGLKLTPAECEWLDLRRERR
ncbi:MAG: aldo/keto reductase [Planctomycetota bacterium]|nr:aldo/keto reductase [Planctomycetota bacterium]